MHHPARWIVFTVTVVLLIVAVSVLKHFTFPQTAIMDMQPTPTTPSPVYRSIATSNFVRKASSVLSTTPEPSEEPTAEPTQEPTAEPTAHQTFDPTTEPTAEPTTEPTAEPTVSPSIQYTHSPTASPTQRPSNPTVRPSKNPSAVPTRAPSARPSAQPSPPPGSPTIRPTISTTQPTTTPTIDPYPTRTLLAFNCSLICGSIDAFTFLDDPRIGVAFVSAFASVMDVSDGAVSLLTVTDFGDTTHSEVRRLSSGSMYSTNKFSVYKDTHTMHTLASAVVVTLQIDVVLETLGYTTTQGSDAYSTLTTRAGTSITSGAFTTVLSEELTTLGSGATITPTTTSFKTNPYTTTLIQTVPPTTAPTTSPKISSSKGGISVVDVIVIVTVLGSVTLLAGLVYGAYKEKQMKLQAQSKVAPLNTTSIVTA